MKKLFALVLACLLLMSGAALAEDLGVQLLDTTQGNMEVMSLDDMQLETEYKIDGYAKVIPRTFAFVDSFSQYAKDRAGDNAAEGLHNAGSDRVIGYVYDGDGWADYFQHIYWNESGELAEFAWLTMDLVNLQKTDIAYFDQIQVKAVFDDEYEFGGWVRQMNYNYNQFVYRRYYDKPYAPIAVLDPENEETVGMLYTGSFVIGCTLPNQVIEGKEPLRLEITLGGNDLTYHIRK